MIVSVISINSSNITINYTGYYHHYSYYYSCYYYYCYYYSIYIILLISFQTL